MTVRLKPLDEQVIVITGASSGIGLATARMAARQGAKVVLGARDRDALARIAEEIRAQGGEAVHSVVDVADEAEMRQLARAALNAFGRIDTWVNNAGISIYGRISEVPLEDQRRLFETNYWGMVIGSRIAVEHLRADGGALINVGSVVSDRSMMLQGPYSASKFAVKGFTDALRMEVEADGLPLSITLIKPGVIATPFEEHARNYMDAEPANPPPAYAPELVAKAILNAACHPHRELTVGGGGKVFSLSQRLAPRMTDWMMERFLPGILRSGGPVRHHDDSLHGPSGRHGHERGGPHTYVRETSLYTAAAMHPLATAAVFAGIGAAGALAWRMSQGRSSRRLLTYMPSGGRSETSEPPTDWARRHAFDTRTAHAGVYNDTGTGTTVETTTETRVPLDEHSLETQRQPS
ncbi:MAG TPA: SDR family oxidoreductase [Azospirillaceae bacterium]|nr:SDR family oxidoreductase [Azospirillaceae bacterium]